MAVTKLALTRTHRRGRVSLEDLGRAKALIPRELQVLEIDVLAQANDAAPGRARQHGLGHRIALAAAPRLPPFSFCLHQADSGRPRITHQRDRQPARLECKPRAGNQAQRKHERVAGELGPRAVAVNDDAAQVFGAFSLDDLSVHNRHLGSGCTERLDVRLGFASLREVDDPFAGGDTMDTGEASGATAKPDAGEVVALEDTVHLDGARGNNHLLRMHKVQEPGLVQDDKRPLVDSDGGSFLEQCYVRRRGGATRQLVHAVTRSSRGELVADSTLVTNDHRASRPRGGQGRGKARDAGSDHGYIRMKVAYLARGRRPRLLDGPGPARPPPP